MLEMDNFDDQSFNEVFDLAIKQVKSLDTEWSNHQLYDPGITLIELFSWLKVVQIGHMSNISKETTMQLLKLLDIFPSYNKPSRTFIKVDNLKSNTIIPKGTKWIADDLIFENEHSLSVFSANIERIELENPEDSVIRKTSEIDGRRSYKIFGNRLSKSKYIPRTFTICFDAPLNMGAWANIYFDTSSKWSEKRNPIKIGDDFVEMADIQWEYFGLKNKVQGWHKVEGLKDKTHCFLFSDLISFKIKGEMLKDNEFYKLRATLIDSHYDHAPVLKSVSSNVFTVVQKDTVCENKVFKKNDIKGDSIVVRSHLAMYGSHKVYIAYDGSWVEKTDYISQVHIDAGCTQFQIENLSDEIASLENSKPAVMIVSYLPDRIPRGTTELASSRGVSSQTMEFDCKDVSYSDFHLMIEKKVKGKRTFDIWSKVDTFFSSNKYDKHYILDWEENRVVFGDNERGKIPDRLDNGIRLINLAYTKGRQSNIRSHRINSLISENELIRELKVEQITSAYGGKDSDDFKSLICKPVNLLNEVKRAITYSDYETIVRRTPGLIIDNVKILPGYLPNDSNIDCNCVTIAVQQGTTVRDERYLENYSVNIKNYFEKFRLINTKIEVTGASYVGIRIVGDVTINSYEDDCRIQIEDYVDKFIKELNRSLGKTLRFGDLFGAIEQLDCVVHLENLHVSPSGDYVKVTKSDDVIIQPNGSYYIEEIRMNYLKSANI